MRRNRILWTSVMGWGLATGAVGCSGGHDHGQNSTGQTGTLTVALTGSAASGAPYHLAHAVFEITNFFVFPAIDMVVPADDPTLKVELPPSVFPFDYQISLHDGWALDAVKADGTEQPVHADLLNNFIPFTIKPQRTTPVVFPFKAGEDVVTVGNGSVGVSISVDDTLIDDFEDGDGAIAPISGRNGVWYVFNDGSGTETPAPGTPVLPEVLDTSANELLRVTGSGFAPLGTLLPDGVNFAYGAGVGAFFVFDPAAGHVVPYDASKYSGIQFTFSTKSSADVPLQVGFSIATAATTPVEQGGTCTSGCYDNFGFVGFVPPGDFTFTGGFSWGQLTQQGFGTPATFDPATVLSIQWVMAFPNVGQPASADVFDFRIDDVAFLPTLIDPPSGTTRPDGGTRGTPDDPRPDAAVLRSRAWSAASNQ
jgi:hypothetical protein